MSNRKQTKRALLTSIMALVMCVVMLVGTTFAWFTDTATANVNKIQAGKLDVILEMQKTDGSWGDAEGQTLQFKKAGNVNQELLWEPGCTYDLPTLRVKNNGNLALKYKILITGIVGNAKLNEAITWTMKIGTAELNLADGEYTLLKEGAVSDDITISGHMKEDAGNGYQGLSIDGIGITVVAAQYTYEYDSKNNTYDEKSTYLNQDSDGAYLIGSAGDLRYFAAVLSANKDTYSGKTIKLTSDIDLSGAIWTPMVADGLTFDGQDHTISNFKADGTYSVGLFGVAQSCTIKNLKVSGATVTGINQAGAIVGKGVCANIDKCEVTNSTITNKNVDDNGDKVGAIIGYLSAEQSASVTNCTVSDSVVKGYRDVGGLIGMANGVGAWTVTGNAVMNTTVINDRSIQSRTIAEDGYNIGEVIGRRSGSSNEESNNTVTNVAISVIGENNAIKTTGENANIVIEDTAVVDSSTTIGKGTTISGTGVDTTTVEAKQAKITTEDVTIKDMTIKADAPAGNSGALDINSSAKSTVIENVNFVGQGFNGDTKGISTSGENLVIRNSKISNVFRGIIFWDNIGGDNVIEDCVIDNVIYTFNINAATVKAGTTLTVKNSKLNGWTSYSGCMTKVSFEDCDLGKSNGYAYIVAYADSEFTGCTFNDGYRIGAGSTGKTLTFTNCKLDDGTVITAENFAEKLGDVDNVMKGCIVIVDGVTVNWN